MRAAGAGVRWMSAGEFRELLRPHSLLARSTEEAAAGLRLIGENLTQKLVFAWGPDDNHDAGRRKQGNSNAQ